VGSVFAALSGVLVAPLLGLAPVALTLLVVQAFGAAAIGAFRNVPVVFLGGIVLGVASEVSQKVSISVGWLGGLPTALPFLVLFAVLLIVPRAKLTRPGRYEERARLQYRSPWPVQLTVGVIFAVLLFLVPQLDGLRLSFYMTGVATGILLLSLGLLVRTSGQVSLCQPAFAAIGATSFSHFAVDFGMPWFLACLLAMVVVVPIGAIVAVPAIRLSGLYLALATMGFALLLSSLCYSANFMFGTLASGRAMPRPSFLQSDTDFYYLMVVVLLVVGAGILLLQRSRLGRALRGMADSPDALTALGQNLNLTKVIVFCISAALAALSGVLYGCAINYSVSTDPFFSPINAITVLAILALAPVREPWYALFGILAAVIPGYLTGANTPNWLMAIFGVFAIQVGMAGGTQPMPAFLRQFLDRLALPVPFKPRSIGHETTEPLNPPVDDAEPGLVVEDLTVRFGGLVAVNGVNIEAPRGRITALIGPNGAGKTTTFNACFGMNRPTGGTVTFSGHNVSSLPTWARARRGIGRTFQIIQLCDSLTVRENVEFGREAWLAGSQLWRQLVASPRERHATISAASEAMELCGISHLADMQAGALSTGQRRLVELARSLAGPYKLLLLDEPSSGLDAAETGHFSEVLRQVVTERHLGILLVEHDMSLIMGICDYIYVLDFGTLIFEGSPAEVAASATVRTAYLGTADLDLMVEREGVE
jgi:ABC-type branched-subunit amino acid transport system ATPase component/ABC-type branched-subunit amino acid transport system permease subunit